MHHTAPHHTMIFPSERVEQRQGACKLDRPTSTEPRYTFFRCNHMRYIYIVMRYKPAATPQNDATRKALALHIQNWLLTTGTTAITIHYSGGGNEPRETLRTERQPSPMLTPWRFSPNKYTGALHNYATLGTATTKQYDSEWCTKSRTKRSVDPYSMYLVVK